MSFAPRILIEGELLVQTPLRVGSGKRAGTAALRAEADKDDPEVDLLCKDARDLPFLPGSTLKGAMRALGEGTKGAEELFGVVQDSDEGRMGALIVLGAALIGDGAFDDGAPWPHASKGRCVAARSSRNAGRDVAAADRGALYYAEQVPPGSRFRFRACYFPMLGDANAEKLLKALIKRLEAGLDLGGGRSSGEGGVRLQSVAVQREYVDASGDLRQTPDPGWLHDAVVAEALTAPIAHMMHLVCDGPFFVDDWAYRTERSQRPDTGEAALRAQRDANGDPRLDGTSVKGALRARCAWLEGGDAPGTARLFGDTKNASRVRVKVSCIKRGEPFRAESVSLDRFSGAPIDGALFAIDAFFGPEFKVTLQLRSRSADGQQQSEADQELMGRLVEDIRANGIQLGHSTTSGFGWFRLKDALPRLDWQDMLTESFPKPSRTLSAENYRGDPDPKHLLAPYRFVHLSNAIAKPEPAIGAALNGAQATLHSLPLKDGVSGELEIDWVAESPLLVGRRNDDVDEPIALANGDYWIPGSSLKGMVRACAEIAGCGRLTRANRDHVFPLRDFTRPDYSERIVGARGGWLWRDADKYFIQDAGVPLKVKIEEVISSYSSDRGIDRFNWLRNTNALSRYGLTGDKARAGNWLVPAARRFRDAGPGADEHTVTPDDNGALSGYLVLANNQMTLRQDSVRNAGVKRYEHVFTIGPDRNQAILVSRRAWRRFELVNTRPGKRGGRDPVGTWAVLEPLLERGPVPVFYAGKLDDQDNRFDFGITRAFKVPHVISVGDVLDRAGHAPEESPDMVEALFGYVWESETKLETARDVTRALKSRLSFSGARIDRNHASSSDEIETIMMAPRASFAPFYLAGKKDWSNEEARPAGRKRYPPRKWATLKAVRHRLNQQLAAGGGQGQGTHTRLRLLTDDTGNLGPSFASRIRFHNISKCELGLLVFALTHGGHLGGPYRHALGRAKPFGAGRLCIKRIGVRAQHGAALDACIDECLKAFVDHMNGGDANFWGDAFPKEPNLFPNTQTILEWLHSSDPRKDGDLPGPKDGNANVGDPDNDLYLRVTYKDRRQNPFQQLRGVGSKPDRLLPAAPLPAKSGVGNTTGAGGGGGPPRKNKRR